MKNISTVDFIKIPLENPNNLEYATSMDISTPSILILGGENTNTQEWARNYCISVAKTLYLNGITRGLNIYSAYYKLRDRNSDLDRLNLFREYRDTKSILDYGNGITLTDLTYMNQSYPLSNTYPNYIYNIFNFAFIPRLLGHNDQMQSPKKTKENFRKMLVFTHCHGAYVLRMIEEHMQQEFDKFTYSLQDMYEIQKNILAINHAPFAPLEQCKFTSLSFASASDTQINYYNELSYHMRKTPEKFKPAFFGQKFGNLMITSRIKEDITKEHSQVGLSGDPRDEHTLTANGKILFATERNALLEGTRAMLESKAIPATSKLICAPDVGFDFDDFKAQAQQIYKDLNIR
ncbi:MAG: hypothetical protein J6K82_03540 [Alphaproteobacteria bacterium]|nr:hypothetical protein [Alphaproteobacteria bacterium]